MKAAVKTLGMSREEWLKCRTRGIGGSDVSAIAGINPYKSVHQLWLEKTGQIEPKESDSEYAHFGTLLEPIIRKEFMLRTGMKVRRRHAMFQSEEYPFMIADLDGIINENGSRAIFEAKTATAYKQGLWEDEVPAPYILQVQHYMAVTGIGKTYIAALVGGNHFCFHVVERDHELVGKIIAMEKYFWETHVIGGVEPVPDGSEATTNYFNERFCHCSGAAVELPEEALSVCAEYERLSEELKKVGEAKDAAANQLKCYLKEAETGTVGNRTVTWKEVSKRTVDSKRLKSEKPEIYNSFLKESSYRRLSVA